jgi:type IV pilus assembly protein PilA
MNNFKAARQQGFTLIELMIVIAIVGILAAIALPAYQDYTVRAKMSEPLAAMAEAKTTVTEYFATRGVLPDDAAQAGINSSPNKEIVASVQFTSAGGGLITAVMQAGVVPTGTTTFLMSGLVDRTSRTIQWKCKEGGASAIEAKYLPSNCRGT